MMSCSLMVEAGGFHCSVWFLSEAGGGFKGVSFVVHARGLGLISSEIGCIDKNEHCTGNLSGRTLEMALAWRLSAAGPEARCALQEVSTLILSLLLQLSCENRGLLCLGTTIYCSILFRMNVFGGLSINTAGESLEWAYQWISDSKLSQAVIILSSI